MDSLGVEYEYKSIQECVAELAREQKVELLLLLAGEVCPGARIFTDADGYRTVQVDSGKDWVDILSIRGEWAAIETIPEVESSEIGFGLAHCFLLIGAELERGEVRHD